MRPLAVDLDGGEVIVKERRVCVRFLFLKSCQASRILLSTAELTGEPLAASAP